MGHGNRSNWKGSERKAALLFPGGTRRPRVGGTYALVADDIIWGKERLLKYRRPPRVWKARLFYGTEFSIGAVYVDVKKRKKSAMVSEFLLLEKKYLRRRSDRLVLITHRKRDQRQFVTVSDGFFYELIRAWCEKHNLFKHAMAQERMNRFTRGNKGENKTKTKTRN